MLDDLTLIWILSYAAAIIAREPNRKELADLAVEELTQFTESLDND